MFQYDELYDEMQERKMESKLQRKDLDRKPKYINKLLKTAERRKRENERRIERQVQKEREEEGEQFKGKESFVTSAYRKKLEELQELEEQEKREEYLESIGDVRKQGNLDGFYRHLYEQKVNYEEEKETKAGGAQQLKEEGGEKTKDKQKSRKYRKRLSSASSDAVESDKEIKLEHLPSNIDADSDFSIDSSSSDTEEKEGQPDIKQEIVVKCEETKNETIETSEEGVEKTIASPPKKLKVNIWAKRTVDSVFEAALQRYFQRKALRERIA